MRWRVAGFTPLLLLSFGACRTASIHSPAVQMHLAVQPTLVHSGDTVRFEFTIINPRPDTLTLEFGGDCRVTFMVLDENQKATGLHGPISRCIEPEAGALILAAGSTWKAQDAWQATTKDGQPLPAGSYVIRGILGEHYAIYQGKREFKLGHAADTVVIRVVASGEE